MSDEGGFFDLFGNGKEMRKRIEAGQKVEVEQQKLSIIALKQDAAMKLFQAAAMEGDGKACEEQRALLHKNLDESLDIMGGMYAIARDATKK